MPSIDNPIAIVRREFGIHVMESGLATPKAANDITNIGKKLDAALAIAFKYDHISI